MRYISYSSTTAPSDQPYLQKGFGDELPGLQQSLERFFAKYGKVAAVRMRRVDGTKAFKVCPYLYTYYLHESPTLPRAPSSLNSWTSKALGCSSMLTQNRHGTARNS